MDHSVCAPGPGIALRAGVERERRSRHVLLYQLHLDDQGLHLKPVVARLADSGDYRLGRSYHIPRSRGGTPPGFLQPSNLDLLPWLRELPSDMFGGILIDGPGDDTPLRGERYENRGVAYRVSADFFSKTTIEDPQCPPRIQLAAVP
ncbi:hypothetical protein [Haliea sp.]